MINWTQLAASNLGIKRAFDAQGLNPARDKLTTAGMDVSQAKTITESKPLTEAVKKDIQDYRAGMANLAPQYDTWGYRAQLLAEGDLGRLETFHGNLSAYLKATAIFPKFDTEA